MRPLSRRQWFHAAGASALSLALPLPRTFADEKPPAPPLSPMNRFPRTVQEFYVERVRAAEKIGADARAKFKTKADAEAYIHDLREKIATCFGKFPDKTPERAGDRRVTPA